MSIDYPTGATPLDPEELEGLKFKHVATCGQLDHLEQGNIQNGLLWLQRHKGTEATKRNDLLKWTKADVSEHVPIWVKIPIPGA